MKSLQEARAAVAAKQAAQLAARTKDKYCGGLPDSVTSDPAFMQYASGPVVAGYIGSYARTATRDKMIVEALKGAGLSDHEVAVWLTSTSGRHIMDDPGKTPYQFAVRAHDWAKDAPGELKKWGER